MIRARSFQILGVATAFAVLLPKGGSAQKSQTAAPWSVRMVNAVMRRHPEVYFRWDYVAGVVLSSIQRVGETRNDGRMRHAARRAHEHRGLDARRRRRTPE